MTYFFHFNFCNYLSLIFSGFDGLLQHVTHLTTRQSSGFRLRLVGSSITSSFPGTNSCSDSRTKRLANVRSTSSWFVQILVAVPSQCGTGQTRSPVVSRNTSGSLSTSSWFPGISLRLPLQLLWRHSTQLHPNAEPHLVCFSQKYAITRSFHA